MPSAASFFAVLRPIPHSASVGRSPITSNQVSSVSWDTPRGLPKSVAIFARSLLSPMPTEQCSPVASSTRARTCSAKSRGSPSSGCPPPTPSPAARNASSQPSTSTTTGTPPHSSERSVSITSADAASYAAWSAGRKTASGHLRAATRSGIPEPTPNARAS